VLRAQLSRLHQYQQLKQAAEAKHVVIKVKDILYGNSMIDPEIHTKFETTYSKHKRKRNL
jgi:hypothetical protein